MRRLIIHTLFICLGMLLLVSCQDKPINSAYKNLTSNSWRSNDTICLTIPAADSLRNMPHTKDRCQPTVIVRTTNKYEYHNLAVKVEISESGKIILADAATFKIFDKDDNQLGNGFPFFEVGKQLSKTMVRDSEKSYKIKIVHNMKLDPIGGISAVGIRF